MYLMVGFSYLHTGKQFDTSCS